ncbi:MAG: hypothetical protein KA524_04210 [Nitrosomonas sp.]|nr:hypothetical protein [Nitrosomonas sp.]MBP6075477.1 hypothetical protein [Nitrosomonas sp.]
MDELLAKLTNLSYDFFGILLPGIIFNIFLLLIWFALDSLVPIWTNNGISKFTIQTLPHLVDTLSLEGRIFVAIPLIFLWYFFGHLLNWIGRSGSPIVGKISDRCRVYQSLKLRIPKPESSYDPKLEPLFKVIQKEFSPKGIELTWSSLYPVFRIYLAQHLSHSLVTTYQNKYTLHRSITTASTLLFWFSLFGILGGIVTLYFYCIQPHWPSLIALSIGSLILVWGFSGSYLYNWTLFGNSIVTETYSLLHASKKCLIL